MMRKKRSFWFKGFMGLLWGFALLLMAELSLWAMGLGGPEEREDPLRGFGGQESLFYLTDSLNGQKVYTTKRFYEQMFEEQIFSEKKTPGTFRIFCFGGSTMRGVPYRPKGTPANFLREMLATIAPDRDFEVINCGATSYGSGRIVPLVKECLRYEPDLFVLYSGHNEFLEARFKELIMAQPPFLLYLKASLMKTRLFVTWRKLLLKVFKQEEKDWDPALDPIQQFRPIPPWDSEARKAIVDNYRENLEEILRMAKKAGVRVILMKVVANLKDFAPYLSLHSPALKDEKGFDAHYKKGMASMKGREWREAVKELQEAQAMDPYHAEVAFRLGQCLFALQRFEEAEEQFFKAVNLDAIPFRDLGDMNQVTEEVGGKYGVIVADTPSAFKRASQKGFLGDDLFIDHCHPNLLGQKLIAGEVVLSMTKAGIVPQKPLSTWFSEPMLAQYEKRLGLTSKDIANAFFTLGCYAMNSPFKGQDIAIGFFNKALEQDSKMAWAYLGLARAYRKSGHEEQAKEAYEKAASYAPHPQLAQAVKRELVTGNW